MNLHYLFVHMLVYNKHLLFNMHSMNKKVMHIYKFKNFRSIKLSCIFQEIKNTHARIILYVTCSLHSRRNMTT